MRLSGLFLQERLNVTAKTRSSINILRVLCEFQSRGINPEQLD